jgi:hypothetical protein
VQDRSTTNVLATPASPGSRISLKSIPTTCPHDLFRREDDPKARASQATPTWAEASHIVINSKQNAATDTAALIIPAVGNNKLRHETLQRFMLCNDSVTVAIEIPIWLDERDIAALELEHALSSQRGFLRPSAPSLATLTSCR